MNPHLSIDLPREYASDALLRTCVFSLETAILPPQAPTTVTPNVRKSCIDRHLGKEYRENKFYKPAKPAPP